ncbi:hypothetical protein VC83_06284 [Pseudogymnoascus destructans]|uniref:C2 domain-containing protein n=1 Tax=Pseudogymnoascus destructans TaxID=655981 RepID=A0A177ABK2_9PEZI|nr:uncharacterized protein VC83_06284 [Pseudogymnoascus destructans]OAF58822.1 hypothetical protein VC83_06284 [Pseudogymnoascus destructans]
MAEKTKVHSAGIFADMTVDGPDIGTLVIIVDRAKNLPNRKSIGKQDPYCAARLGKEAKKTNTDRRGGQTPKWDQELRFAVHDSPDYYQLKVSVFNDDKKTDLIGEAWVNLQDVLVPGGGQNDLWHTLNCRGKYAGEIRIEITYYDTRPKQEKLRERVREGAPSAVEGGPRESLSGPRGPKEKLMKRRPLPSDPTGATPSPIETPERVLPQPSRGYTNGTPDHPPQQPKMHAAPVPEYTQSPQPIAYNTPEHVQPPQQRQYATPEHVQVQQPRGSAYNTPPTYIQAQSPLQNLEYNTPTHVRTHSQVIQGRYGPTGMDQPPLQTDYNTPPPHVLPQSHSKHVSPAIKSYNQAPGMAPDRHHPRDMYNDRHDDGQPREENYNGSNVSSRHEDPYTRSRNDLRQEYAPQQMAYEPPVSDYDPPSSPDGPPPPPPVHRVHQTAVAPASSPGYGFPPPNPTREAQFDHLRQDNPRQSMPAYSQNVPQQPQPYTPPRQQHAPAPAPPPSSYGQQDHYQGSRSRHNSYDDRYHNSTFSSMQPTVEDAPPSPTPFATASHRASEPQMSQYGDRRYDDVPSPAPLNLNGMGSTTSGNYKMNSNAYKNNASHEAIDNRHSDPYYDQPPPARSYTQDSIEPPQTSPMPSLPPSLVAGFDPLIQRGISDRIHSDTRPRDDSYSQFSSAPTHYSESPQSYQPPKPQYHNDARSEHYTQPMGYPPQAAPADRQSRGIPSTYTNPHPHHPPQIRLPRPPSPSPRPLSSSVPFGPDDYSSLNPHAPAVTPTEPDPDAKIILYDGREVDPSDHLPQASWAALPPNLQKKLDAAARQRAPAAGGARRMERRERPQSSYAEQTPAPAAQGRTRLQKKAHRVSAAPAPVGGSSPLAPIIDAWVEGWGGRSLPRAQAGDWGGEEYGGVNGYSTGSPGYRGQGGCGGMGGPPPVPGKVPMSAGQGRGEPQENAWALLEEMKSIDLGSGRARRRKGGAVV